MEMLEIQINAEVEMEGTVGKALGFGVQTTKAIKALLRYGISIVEDAEIVLHIGPAHLMAPIPGKKNVLYTAWETLDLPDSYKANSSQMDLIIGVSQFVSKVFHRAHPGIPIVTCPLGVDVNVFSYIKRRYSEPFIFLWLGAPSDRKGWQMVQFIWKDFVGRKDCLLLMKTTKPDGKIEQSSNVVFDTRKLEEEDLVKVYHFAHCYLFPSYAEGFGLTLAEAMATGMPCIFTPWGGVIDFASNKNAFPMSYSTMEVDYGVKSVGAMAKPEDMVQKMNFVMKNYSRAVVKAKEARRTIEDGFTWDNTGRRLKKILEDFKNGTYS
jgi:glycosyltransferase involved in cell wall biosynthesis